jgi:hypothetical protein
MQLRKTTVRPANNRSPCQDASSRAILISAETPTAVCVWSPQTPMSTFDRRMRVRASAFHPFDACLIDHVARHRGHLREDGPIEIAAYQVMAVLVEGQSVRMVTKEHGVSKTWPYELLAR